VIVTVHHGDCLDVLRGMGEASVDSVVTDPPYGLEFMGREWDAPWQVSSKSKLFGKRERPMPGWGVTRNANCRACSGRMRGAKTCRCERPEWDEAPEATRVRQMRGFQDWCEAWAREVFRVLKPGGHAAIFGGTRTYHRMVCAIEDAGFEVRDQLAWCFGTGFPKSHNLPGGLGTALKPAWEPIVLARKPLACPTVAAQVLATGTGALNIGACRVPTEENLNGGTYLGERREHDEQRCLDGGKLRNGIGEYRQPAGRWPANLVHDGSPEVLAAFAAFGERKSTGGGLRNGDKFGGGYKPPGVPTIGFGDTGTAARFFYSAKASKAERAGSKHPTVKPVSLMRWLCRLVTPPGGTCLDPFAGSGTTGEAALREGFSAVLIEREAEYVADIERRLACYRDEAPLLAEVAA
jgi:DNA modification methylase